jgi:heterodisulfide reductase subunit A-like polyferredoxin
MIESEEYRANLIKIAERLRKKQQGIPTDEKGDPSETYLEYLSLMYNAQAARIVQHLPVFPAGITVRKLSKITNLDRKQLKAVLNPLVERFFLFETGGYSLPNPLMIYDAPFIIRKNLERDDIKEFAQLSRKFFEEEEYYKQWETSYKGTPRSRILTVSEEIEDKREIIPVEEVYSIIEQNESFALVPCPCRKRAEIEGIRKCRDKYPIYNCIILGNQAEALLSLSDPESRRASKEEVIKIAQDAAKMGLVHTTDNYSGPANILCQCCECCCGLLAGLTRPGLHNPKSIAPANYLATVDADKCVACGTCEDRCKFGAITIEDIALINEDKCMGCGLCAVTCPNDALTMKRLEREPIPAPKTKK